MGKAKVAVLPEVEVMVPCPIVAPLRVAVTVPPAMQHITGLVSRVLGLHMKEGQTEAKS